MCANSSLIGLFDDIRPYHDDEVERVLQRLINNNELIDALTTFNFPKLSPFIKPVLQFLVKRTLAKKIHHINTVYKFQQLVEPYMIKVIERSTASVSWSGLNDLSKEKSYLFLSNHRDIVLDPALVNYGLHLDERDTVRVAIGDNLLSKLYVSDLMRLNKSFIVKRSLETRKEKVDALKTLSAYITHSVATNHSVWLAHREGRAKDGNDVTDPAILKMLSLTHKKIGFENMLSSLNIVPVAISYEVNPCDFMKAKELHLRQSTGEYTKSDNEDLDSIIAGIQGQKNHVHVAFGQPLPVTLKDPASCAEAIDRQIHQLYKLFPINFSAYNILENQGHKDYQKSLKENKDYSEDLLVKGDRLLNSRLEKCDDHAKEWLLKMYANPVKNQMNHK